MIFTETRCFIQIDDPSAEHGYITTFIESGFVGAWIKVSECSDYALNVGYASEDENIILNETEKAAKDIRRRK